MSACMLCHREMDPRWLETHSFGQACSTSKGEVWLHCRLAAMERRIKILEDSVYRPDEPPSIARRP